MIAFRGLDPQLRPYADAAMRMAGEYGLSPIVTSVLRTMDKQRLLRDNYERCLAAGVQGTDVSFGPGLSCKWPANRPGDSAHNYGVAFDSWVPPEQMELWVAIRRHIGWHVPDNDVIHAELPNWRSYFQRS